MGKQRRKWGDRKDGRWVKDTTGLQTIMAHLMPNRTDNEVYLHDTIDATELVRYLEKKNENLDYKITLFHCTITALARMIKERPLMNRFIQGHRMYERNEISRKIVGDVKETRKSEYSTGGVDALLDSFAKIPRPLLMLIVRIIRWPDFWGVNPDFITAGDPNYTTILCSNLGSIKCPAVYHHLNNYGTNSIMITIGTLHKEEMRMPDGHKEIRDVIDIGATLDERIADGFYFARSLKLIKHICANPELLEKPLRENSGFEYH